MTQRPGPRLALLDSFGQGTEGQIIAHVGQSLSDEGLPVDMLAGRGRLLRVSLLPAIARCDLLIVHSPLAYALFHVLFARLFKRKVVALIWDHYPVTLAGQRHDPSLRRRLLDLMERCTSALCTQLVVPSRDFLAADGLSDASVLPFWLPAARAPGDGGAVRDGALRIIFAGQVNNTRGLDHAHAELQAHFGNEFVLAIASRDPLPACLAGKPNVEHLGFLGPDALRQEIARCHAGLVALSPQLDGPGLPSKTWSYLDAGLTCLFIGKALPHYVEALTSSGAGHALSPATRGIISASDVARRRDAASIDRFSRHFALDAARLAAHLHSIAAAAGEAGQS